MEEEMHGRIAIGLVAGTLSLAATAATARAQEYPPITDRDYAIDLYRGAVLGSVRIVGMGGATVAQAEGSAGALANPAAAAIRRTTSTRYWDWDFHLDALSAVFASDFDNNGQADSNEFASTVATAGIAGMAGPWGLAITATTSSTQIGQAGSEGGDGELLEPQGIVARVALARSLFDDDHVIGVSIRFGSFALVRPGGGANGGDQELFSIGGGSLEAGWVWRPYLSDLRIGVSAALPITGKDVSTEACDPLACEGHILPERVAVPWEAAAGIAWRRAGTRWNQPIGGDWRDERSLLVEADVLVSGAVPDGYGLEGFAAGVLQPSGRRTVVSARAGAEYEWIPGWLRLRGGTYWEPSRFEGVGGRLHATLGLDTRLFSFCFWDGRYRVRLSLTGDAAARYGNAGVSVGFWH
jgi:hypothetical protein